MGLGAPGLDQHVPDPAPERQLGEPVTVKMPELTPAEAELETAEPVWVHGHAGPASDLLLDASGGRLHRVSLYHRPAGIWRRAGARKRVGR
jgi:hypothetical protein